MTARTFWYSEHMLSLHSDWKHVDNNSPGLILSQNSIIIKTRLLFIRVFSAHNRGKGQSQGTYREKDAKVNILQGYVRESYLSFLSHWYFLLLGNKCSLFKDHVNNSFYALLHCMKKAAPVMGSSSHPCDLTASQSTSLTQIPPWRCCGIISVGNSSVLLEGCKRIHFILLCLIHKPSSVNSLAAKIKCNHVSLPFVFPSFSLNAAVGSNRGYCPLFKFPLFS